MNILILSQYFAPEFAIIPGTLTRNLVANGHEVSVLTTFPNYPQGRLFPGYKQRLTQIEQIDGATVLRVPMFINRSQKPLLRMLSYLSFSISAALRFKFVEKTDVVYVYATQMTPALAASLWFRIRRTPFVLHIQDLWPESVTGSGLVKSSRINNLITYLINLWLKGIYHRSHKLIAIAPEMTRMLIERGIPSNKISTVFNWADESVTSTHGIRSDEINALKARYKNHTKFVYSGNLGEMQALYSIIDAFSSLTPGELSKSHLFIVGSGNQESNLIQQAAENQLSNVSFIGRVLPEQMPEVYELSDFQIISLKNLPVFRGTIPSKLQGSLSAGIPVLSAVNGDVRELVSKHQLGFTAESENTVSIAAAIRKAIYSTTPERNQLSANAKAFYESNMSASTGTGRIEHLLISAARNTHTKGADNNV